MAHIFYNIYAFQLENISDFLNDDIAQLSRSAHQRAPKVHRQGDLLKVKLTLFGTGLPRLAVCLLLYPLFRIIRYSVKIADGTTTARSYAKEAPFPAAVVEIITGKRHVSSSEAP